ncbi:hypothetical protein EVA_04583 [gut metagenome]|uniref:Uncharacterized protein n=1 Tax=gut metagenome TaxID=749906 RepID=J9GJ96_9ZZZZ
MTSANEGRRADYGEEMMYGRGMPRPIAEVTPANEGETATQSRSNYS